MYQGFKVRPDAGMKFRLADGSTAFISGKYLSTTAGQKEFQLDCPYYTKYNIIYIYSEAALLRQGD